MARMTGETPIASGGPGVYERIELRLDRIEDKLDRRMTTLDAKVDGLAQRQDTLEGKLDGSLSVIKWLGPVGVAALIAGLLAIYGVIPIGTGT